MRKESAIFLGWAISFALFFGLYLYYLNASAPLVPYMDSVRYIGQINDALTGAISWRDVWHQSGSVGLLYQLVLLIEWIFWGLNSRVTVIFTALVWALLFILYAKSLSPLFVQWRMARSLNATLMAIFAFQMLIGFFLFSPAGWEIWLLDLGFAQTLKNLFIAVYLYLLARIDFQTGTVGKFLLYGLLGMLIVLFVSYNWSYAFVVAALFVIFMRQGMNFSHRFRGLYIVLPVLLAQVIYVRAAKGGLNAMAVTADLRGAGDLLMAVTYGAASIFMGIETMEWLRVPPTLAMIIGAFFLLAAMLIFYVWLRSGLTHPSGIFFAAICIFGLAALASISVARGGLGFQFSASSRYFMDYQFVMIGLLGLTMCLITNLNDAANTQVNCFGAKLKAKKIAWSFVSIFGILVLAGQVTTYYVEYAKAPYRAAYNKEQSLAYLSGVISKQNISMLQTEERDLVKAMPVISRYNLGSLRHFSGPCNVSQALTFGDVFASESQGRWMGKSGIFVLGSCPGTIHVEGYLPVGVAPRTVTVNVGGEKYEVASRPGEAFSISVTPHATRRVTRVVLSVDHAHTLKNVALSDNRELGVFLTKIGQ